MLFRTRILVTSNFVQQSGRNARPRQKSLEVRSTAGVGVILFREEYLALDSAFSFYGGPQAESNRATTPSACRSTIKSTPRLYPSLSLSPAPKNAPSEDSRSLNRRCREGRIGRPFRLRSEQQVDQLLRRELSDSGHIRSSLERMS